MRPAESVARTCIVQEAEESRAQEGQEEEPGAVETEEQEDETEKTAEPAVPTNQSESTEEQANNQYSWWRKTHTFKFDVWFPA